jgi:hypothetical protein
MSKVRISPVAAALIGATIALLPASAHAWPSDWHVLGWGGPGGYYRYEHSRCSASASDFGACRCSYSKRTGSGMLAPTIPHKGRKSRLACIYHHCSKAI